MKNKTVIYIIVSFVIGFLLSLIRTDSERYLTRSVTYNPLFYGFLFSFFAALTVILPLKLLDRFKDKKIIYDNIRKALWVSIPLAFMGMFSYPQLEPPVLFFRSVVGMMEFLIFTVIIFLGLIFFSPLMHVVRPAVDGQKQKVRPKDRLKLPLPLEMVYELCIIGASFVLGGYVREEDREKGILVVKTGISWASAGEVVTFKLEKEDDKITIVEIDSKPAFSTTLFDYGKNKENIIRVTNFLASATDSILKEESLGFGSLIEEMLKNIYELYHTIKGDIEKSGYQLLEKQLAAIKQSLDYDEVDRLQKEGKWTESISILSEVIRELQLIREKAIGYKKTGFDEDVKKAQLILGISATEDIAEIKNAYRKMSFELHPDRNVNSTDEKMKELNWAYGYFKKLYQFN